MSASSSEESAHASDDRSRRHESSSSDESDSKSSSKDGREVERPKDSAPLPNEEPPPLPTELPPAEPIDDGWAPVWDEHAQGFYFFNRFTSKSQWENPRVPEAPEPGPPGVGNYDRLAGAQTDAPPSKAVAGGYDPSIHGDYDPNADYAKVHETALPEVAVAGAPGTDPTEAYAATGAFNRFTGKWQAADLNPEKFNDENKSKRQMNAFFDVDAAANSHDGKSLKAERSGKKLSKKEVKAFRDKRREKKEEKRRAWLRD